MNLIPITERQWKQICEGLRRKILGPFVQKNSNDGSDSIRRYVNSQDEAVIIMTVYKANTDLEGYKCSRLFQCDEQFLELIKHIFIPTQEQLARWDSEGLDESLEMSKIDPGYAS